MVWFKKNWVTNLDEKYVAYHEMDSFTSYEEYPCKIVDLKYTEFRYGTSSQNRILFQTICTYNQFSRTYSYITFPFTKDSPFREPLMKTFNKMKSKGILDKIWQDHQSQLIIEREERKVKFHHLNC